jgi:hypothetical protein
MSGSSGRTYAVSGETTEWEDILIKKGIRTKEEVLLEEQALLEEEAEQVLSLLALLVQNYRY